MSTSGEAAVSHSAERAALTPLIPAPSSRRFPAQFLAEGRLTQARLGLLMRCSNLPQGEQPLNVIDAIQNIAHAAC
jgi:hypothetical protein